MKIGFLMGSFDPIHVGHINMVRAVLNSKIVDKVIIVPSGHNPWKKEAPVPFDIRLDMIYLSIKAFNGKCVSSDIESKFDPPFYANKSLNYFREIYDKDEKYIICGTDTVMKIPFWKDFETDIFPFYGVIEVNRDKSISEGEITQQCAPIKLKSGNKADYVYYSIPIKALDISSTMIRDEIKKGNELYPLLPEGVIEIINKNNLYR